MIQYETKDSPFFITNKIYCNSIEQKLKTLNLDCIGFCNSYGYDIEANFHRNDLEYFIKLKKYQNTQGNIVLPTNSTEYAGCEIIIKGINEIFSFKLGRSQLIRFLTSKEFKKILPSPYFLITNIPSNHDSIEFCIQKILSYKISKIKIKNKFFIK